ncbi:MAG TPA: zinc ribbon domain-containing protein [Dictyobacter sp.]|nr:zinc ribbon domain-containing protein [Dictyobacter sp.]
MDTTRCAHCGNEVETEANFCGRCGINIQEFIKTYHGENVTQPIPPSDTSLFNHTTLSYTHNSGIPPSNRGIPPSNRGIPPSVPPVQLQHPVPIHHMMQHSLQTYQQTPAQIMPRHDPKGKPSPFRFQHMTLFHRRLLLLIALGSFLLSIFPYYQLYNFIHNRAYHESPAYTLQLYCDALKENDFIAAYTLLSKKHHDGKITKLQFKQQLQSLVDGPLKGVRDCKVAIMNQFNQCAHGTITFIYGNATQATKPYELIKNRRNKWRINTDNWQVVRTNQS